MSAYQVVCCLMTFRFDRVRYLILFRISILNKVFIFYYLKKQNLFKQAKGFRSVLICEESNVYSSFICVDVYSYIPDMFSYKKFSWNQFQYHYLQYPFLALQLRSKEYSIPDLMECCSSFITSWTKATCFVNMEHICAPYILEQEPSTYPMAVCYSSVGNLI